MSRPPRSSAPAPADAELRLPRAPGVIRQFWARHPLLTDILITLVGVALALATATPGRSGAPTAAVHVLDVAGTVLALAAAAALMLRRRWPLVPFALAVALQIVLLGTAGAAGSPLIAIPTYALAVYRSNRVCWIAYGTAMSTIALVGSTTVVTGAVTVQSALNSLLSVGVMGLIGALVGINVGNRKRYLEAVIDRSRQLVIERDQQAQLAAAAERGRIAREMHDVVSHSLTVIVALSEGASATADVERARGAMDAAADTARGALAEMRTMLGVLRDGDADAPLAPLEPVSPHEVVSAAQRAGYPVTISAIDARELPEAARYAVGRIVQEGVTNAMRHASAATSVAVTVERSSDVVTVRVRNDGAAPRANTAGFGLRGLAERVAHLGGTTTAGPEGRDGWLLVATVPVPSEDAEAGQDDAEDPT